MTDTQTTLATSSAVAPGTCGELAQGMLDGVTFLLTCPIDLYATATVEWREGDGKISAPSASSKAALALQYTLEFLGIGDRLDAKLYLKSPLPRGKGMASSTADVAATVVATAIAAGRPVSDDVIAEIALRIEPSDGLMYSGITRFDHRLGSYAQKLGDPPPMRVVILDFGGTVDTLQFNNVDVSASLISSEEVLREAVELISQGIQESDVEKIGRGSTMSARANQAILYKPQLENAIALASEIGAAGVNVAHSGTVIGMLVEDDDMQVRRAASLAWERLAGLKSVRCQRVIGGGVTAIAKREVLGI
jgi:L-threonine kinase